MPDGEMLVAGMNFGRTSEGINGLESNAERSDLVQTLSLGAAKNIADTLHIFFIEELPVMAHFKMVAA